MNNTEILKTIWDALHEYREDCISTVDGDDQWDDICLAMALLHENLNVSHEDT